MTHTSGLRLNNTNFIGKTLFFNEVYLKAAFSLAGPKEGAGLLGGTFDVVLDNDKFGEKTFEKAERKMFSFALESVIRKINLTYSDIDAVLGGDLLNQIVSTSFAMRDINSAFLGLYNACGTYAESLLLGAALVDKFMNNVICLSGSHFSTAERQYRYPLELGVLRPPAAQWTATGVGSTVLSKRGAPGTPRIASATMGRVIDFGIKDANNMGAAMAPAAVDTILQVFKDTGKSPDSYDMIFTGDLGYFGKAVVIDMMRRNNYDFTKNYEDCGAALYEKQQQTNMGGSGAACSAIVTNGYIIKKLQRKELKNILLVGTGALMSPTTAFQGETIPCIGHAVEITVAPATESKRN